MTTGSAFGFSSAAKGSSRYTILASNDGLPFADLAVKASPSALLAPKSLQAMRDGWEKLKEGGTEALKSLKRTPSQFWAEPSLDPAAEVELWPSRWSHQRISDFLCSNGGAEFGGARPACTLSDALSPYGVDDRRIMAARRARPVTAVEWTGFTWCGHPSVSVGMCELWKQATSFHISLRNAMSANSCIFGQAVSARVGASA
jgi:hypothetical protein